MCTPALPGASPRTRRGGAWVLVLGLAMLGAWHLIRHPQILWALSPVYGVRLLMQADLATGLRPWMICG